jgi:NitT/TauT family transport system ATP-binding protein
VTAVSLSGVSKIFNPGRPDEVTALSGIDLTVGDGRFVSLIGPSGCGKSTLLRLIADLIPATAGTVEVAGKSAPQARLDQEYGIAFQQAGLFEWRTVQRNVELPLELRGASRAARRDRALEMLALVGLADFAGHYPAQLSGGMQQRVAIARALAVHPPLLLMDEPFGALDEMTRERLQTELLAICAQTGTSTVFVTHSISEAVFLSDRVVVMSPRPGRITATIDVDLPARDDAARQSPAYFEAITSVRRALRGVDTPPGAATAPDTAPSPRTSGSAPSAATAP